MSRNPPRPQRIGALALGIAALGASALVVACGDDAPPAAPQRLSAADAEAALAAREARALAEDGGLRALAPAAPAAQKAEDALTVSVRLLDPAARPLAGGTLAWLAPGTLLAEPRRVARADGTGAAWLHVPWSELDSTQPLAFALHAPGRVREQRVLEPAQWNASEVLSLGEAMLAEGGTVAGRVVDEAGAGVAGALVALSTELGEMDDAQREMARLWPLISDLGVAGVAPLAESGADGSFTLDGAPLGRFALVATLVGAEDPRLPDREQGVAVAAGETTRVRDLVLRRAKEAELVRGVVLAPDGAPLAGAQVGLLDEADGRLLPGRTLAGDDGRFALAAPAALTLRVVARDPAQRWPPAEARGARAGGAALELRLRPE